MAIDIPDSPSNGDTYNVGDRTWRFNGTTWDAVLYSAPTGPTGATGDTGIVGPTGPTGEGVAAGGTTGQVLAKASGTDYDTEWAAATPITTQGDLIVGGAGGAPERLANSGIEGDVLAVNATGGLGFVTPSGGGATAAYTVIDSGTVTSSTLSITGIPSTYDDIIFEVANAGATELEIRFNGITTTNYGYKQVNPGGSDSAASSQNVLKMNNMSSFRMRIPNYSLTNSGVDTWSILCIVHGQRYGGIGQYLGALRFAAGPGAGILSQIDVINSASYDYKLVGVSYGYNS